MSLCKSYYKTTEQIIWYEMRWVSGRIGSLSFKKTSELKWQLIETIKKKYQNQKNRDHNCCLNALWQIKVLKWLMWRKVVPFFSSLALLMFKWSTPLCKMDYISCGWCAVFFYRKENLLFCFQTKTRKTRNFTYILNI